MLSTCIVLKVINLVNVEFRQPIEASEMYEIISSNDFLITLCDCLE